MNPTERMLLHLLDCSLRGRTPDPSLLKDVDWNALYSSAQEHHITALLLDAVCALPEELCPPADIMTPWQETAMLTLMSQSLLVSQLHRLLAAFEEAGVHVASLKGVSLKMLYPQPDLRTMSDADLLVQAEHMEEASAVFASQGYTRLEEEPGVTVYGGPEGLRVELHTRLFDKTAYGFLSRLDEEKLFPFHLVRRERVYGGEAWVFPPKEHALFMLCHMAKHMITTGFGLRQTTDFVLFCGAYDADMDWETFWPEANALGLGAFCSAILELGVTYLSLPQGRWSQGAQINTEAAEGLLLDMLDAGVFGNRTEGRRRSAAVVYRAYDTKDGDAGRLRRAIFPSATSLKAPYLYARRVRVLLPVAWVHRWIRYAVSLITGKAKHADATAGIEVADARLQLLDALGLRDRES